ncbi:MAG: M4 family metallopeptidase [bacterium]|nr:M4 family metallopeptidase [bacterium]
MAAIIANKAVFGLTDPLQDLRATPVVTDALGCAHVRFDQFHHGIPVYGGEIKVHLDASGRVYSISGKTTDRLPDSVVPSIGDEGARDVAAFQFMSGNTPRGSVEFISTRLVMMPLDIVTNTQRAMAHLAWEISLQDQNESLTGQTFYVDANNGEVIFSQPHAYMFERHVLDCSYPNNSNNDPNCISYYQSSYYNYTFGRTEGAPPRGPNPVWDSPFLGSCDTDTMYDHLALIHNFTVSNFGLNGANNLGGLAIPPLVSPTLTRGFTLIDFDSPTGVCPYSAFFDTYKGNVSFCVDMVILDIVGHEYTHGIVHHRFIDENNLPIGPVYYGECGALNEAFADIVAETLELTVRGSTDWIFGANAPGGPFRNLANPEASGLDRVYPTHYCSDNMYCGTEDYGGVHRNSTVPSHAFYLIANGGTVNGCDVALQGVDVAKQVFYRGWANYFSRTETFNEAYIHLLEAAADLYPPEIVNQVRIALQAAEMDQPGYCSGIPAQIPACAGLTGVEDVSTGAGSIVESLGPNPSEGRVSLSTDSAAPVPSRSRSTMFVVVWWPRRWKDGRNPARKRRFGMVRPMTINE